MRKVVLSFRKGGGFEEFIVPLAMLSIEGCVLQLDPLTRKAFTIWTNATITKFGGYDMTLDQFER